MKPVDRTKWFWTPERLKLLKDILDEVALDDGSGGKYFPREGVRPLVWRHYARFGVVRPGATYNMIDPVMIGEGLRIMVFLGGIESVQGRGHIRRYYPEKLRELGWAEINSFREAFNRRRFGGGGGQTGR